jgi:hypothetical protein
MVVQFFINSVRFIAETQKNRLFNLVAAAVALTLNGRDHMENLDNIRTDLREVGWEGMDCMIGNSGGLM